MNESLLTVFDTDSPARKKQKEVLLKLIRNELTERQRDIFLMYHVGNQSMVAIAASLGVNKSTVSRTLKRAEQKIAKITQYL